MMNDAEYLFIYFLPSVFLGEVSIQIFFQFLLGFVFVDGWFWEFFIYMDTSL